MSVAFKGGTSGNREDHLPPTPNSGDPQPIQMTETKGKSQGNIHLNALNKHGTHPFDQSTPDFLPDGGTNDVIRTDSGHSPALDRLMNEVGPMFRGSGKEPPYGKVPQ